jgi:hypothetical protein
MTQPIDQFYVGNRLDNQKTHLNIFLIWIHSSSLEVNSHINNKIFLSGIIISDTQSVAK